MKKTNWKKKFLDLEEKYKRALADYQNLQKRTEREKEEFLKFANSSLILKFLDIKDQLEKAEEQLKDEGLSLILKNFDQILRSEGVEEIKSEGEKFDPSLFECVGLVKVEKEDLEDRVVEVVRKGYKIKVGGEERVLRPSQVKVGKRKISKEAEKAEKASYFGKYV